MISFSYKGHNHYLRGTVVLFDTDHIGDAVYAAGVLGLDDFEMDTNTGIPDRWIKDRLKSEREAGYDEGYWEASDDDTSYEEGYDDGYAEGYDDGTTEATPTAAAT